MHRSQLIDEYANGPAALAVVLADFENLEIDARPIPRAWSIREVVCHLADTEIVYADRIKRVLAEDEPTFFEADPDCFTAALRPLNRPLASELQLIVAVRAHLLPIFERSAFRPLRQTFA